MAKLLQMSLLFGALLDSEIADPEIPAPDIPVPDIPAPELGASEPPKAASLRSEALPPAAEDTPSDDVADVTERRLALDIGRSWIVEAPAGSGKTGLLIQRFLKLLAYGGVEQPEEILAITFTRKADAEMRHRVLAQLAAARQGTPLPSRATSFERTTRHLAEAALARDRALGWHLLENPRQLNIRTIDSFCAELAGSLPLVAGAGGRYAPTDDPGPIYELAAERTLMHMGGPDRVLSHDLEDLLLHRDAQPGDVKRLLADMLRGRDQWGELIPLNTEKLTDSALDGEVRPRLDHTLQRLIGQELAATADLIGPDLLGRLASLAHTLSTCPGYKGEASPIALCEGRSQAPTASALDLDHWVCLTNLLLKGDGDWRSSLTRNVLRFEASRPEQQQLGELIQAFKAREVQHPGLRDALCSLQDLPDPQFPDDQWRVVKSLYRVLYQGLLELQLLFAERHVCDFTEVALTARTLVRSEAAASDLLNTSVARLRHLLVDEMQDTSAGQYELLEALTAGWDGVTQTLFLVGDPKQSIYEFRQARVERFRRVMNDRCFGQLTVDPLRLTANFRSQAALVDAFNTAFEQILPSPDDPTLTPESVDVPFIAATATRPAGAHPALHWHIAEEPPGEALHADGAELEDDADRLEPTPAAHARAIRETIERFLISWPGENKDRAPRIAVLARNRAHLAPVLQEFHADRGGGPLAFRAVDIEALNERPEILDLLALTRALLNPADRVAWLAVLRSPVCGLTLPDLLALTGDGSEANPHDTLLHLIATRADRVSLDGQQRLARTWSVLGQAQSDLGRTAFSVHVERTWRTLGGDASLHSHEKNNARRFLNLLHECERGPETLSLSLLNRRLRTLYAEPSAPDAAVELMTIHKAKGLEWDLVLIPALHRGSGRGDAQILKWLEFDSPEAQPEFLLAPIQSKGEDPSRLASWLNRRQRARESGEAKRLFYVACTRAREELHLFATIARKADGSVATPKRADSLLTAAWPAAQAAMNAQAAQPPRRSNTTSAEVLAFPAPPASRSSLSLAAAAADGNDLDEPEPAPFQSHVKEPATGIPGSSLRRIPLSFNPQAHLQPGHGPLFSYPPAESLRTEAIFARPEGSFAARAFGNVVHRFLELLASRLAGGQTVGELQAELPGWAARLTATLRSEGIAPSLAASEARRALQALQTTLADPDGVWILSPQMQARSEAAIPSPVAAESTSLRADRTFVAGPIPHIMGERAHLWIVDYKTAELGGRSREIFLVDQQQKYTPQMEAYAHAAIAAGHPPDRIILALYFPLVPALLYWPGGATGPPQ